MEKSQIEKILSAYNGYADIDGFAKVVTNEEILEANSVLSISYYVEGIDEDGFDLDDSLQIWKDGSESFNKEIESLVKMVIGEEYV